MTKEEAIKWVDDRMCWGRGRFTENHPPNIDECWEAGRMAIKALKSERESGEWIERISGNGWNEWTDLYCPKCETVYCHVDSPSHYNFCPNCGASMRPKDGEEE